MSGAAPRWSCLLGEGCSFGLLRGQEWVARAAGVECVGCVMMVRLSLRVTVVRSSECYQFVFGRRVDGYVGRTTHSGG